MLNDILLLQIRANAARWLKDTCTISRDTGTLDELGSPVSGSTIIATNVPCRIIKSKTISSSTAAIIGGAETLREIYKIAIPTTYQLDIDYQIASGGVTYDVVNIEAALTDGIFTQAIITRHR